MHFRLLTGLRMLEIANNLGAGNFHSLRVAWGAAGARLRRSDGRPGAEAPAA